MITPQEFADKLKKALLIIKETDPPLRLAAYDTLGKQSKRIFTQGRLTDGSQIGQYNSTTPLYLNPAKTFNASMLGPPKGKTGRTKFESGKKKGQDHKTIYVESYKAYRQKIGRETAYVNLELSGDMRSDYENPQNGVPTPEKLNTHEYLSIMKREINRKKASGQQARYGEVFFLTRNEKNNFFAIAAFQLRRLLSEGSTERI